MGTWAFAIEYVIYCNCLRHITLMCTLCHFRCKWLGHRILRFLWFSRTHCACQNGRWSGRGTEWQWPILGGWHCPICSGCNQRCYLFFGPTSFGINIFIPVGQNSASPRVQLKTHLITIELSGQVMHYILTVIFCKEFLGVTKPPTYAVLC